jgi:hypothetical protein
MLHKAQAVVMETSVVFLPSVALRGQDACLQLVLQLIQIPDTQHGRAATCWKERVRPASQRSKRTWLRADVNRHLNYPALRVRDLRGRPPVPTRGPATTR